MNSGKSADEYGVQAEHLKSAGRHVLPLLVTLFNDIVSSGEVPESFKSGILTPVDNYGGITVTATICKVFEYALLDKLTETGLNRNQSDLQIGFSKGLSPGLGSLFLSEASYEAHIICTPTVYCPDGQSEGI